MSFPMTWATRRTLGRGMCFLVLLCSSFTCASVSALPTRAVGHSGGINALAWQPGSTRLATASQDNTVLVWEASKNTPAAVLTGHGGPVTDIAWKPDGSVIASASDDGTIRLWDGRTFAPGPIVVQSDHTMNRVAWSDDGALAAGCHDGIVYIRIPGGEHILRLQTVGVSSPVRNIAWNPVRNWLAAGHDNGKVQVWDGESGRLIASCDRKLPVLRLCWDHSGDVLAVASNNRDCRVDLWWPELNKLTSIPTLFRGYECLLEWSPRGPILAVSGGSKEVSVWYVGQRVIRLLSLRGDMVKILGLTWHRDGNRIFIASGGGRVALWDVWEGARSRLTKLEHHVNVLCLNDAGSHLAAGSTGERTASVLSGDELRSLSVLKGFRREVVSLQWNADATLIAGGLEDGTVLVWSSDLTRLIRRYKSNSRFPILRWSPRDPTMAVVVDDRGRVFRCNVVAGSQDELLNGALEPGGCEVAWSPTGEYLAVGFLSGMVHLLSADKSFPTMYVFKDSAKLTALAWLDGGKYLASGSSEGVLTVHDVADGSTRSIEPVGSILSLAGRPGTDWVSVGTTKGGGSVWSARDGTRQFTLFQGLRPQWSPDGTTLATDWNIRKLTQPSTYRNPSYRSLRHQGRVRGLGWCPIGMRLATASEDGSLRLWSDTGELIRRITVGAGRPLYSMAWDGRGSMIAVGCEGGGVYVLDADAAKVVAHVRVSPPRITAPCQAPAEDSRDETVVKPSTSNPIPPDQPKTDSVAEAQKLFRILRPWASMRAKSSPIADLHSALEDLSAFPPDVIREAIAAERRLEVENLERRGTACRSDRQRQPTSTDHSSRALGILRNGRAPARNRAAPSPAPTPAWATHVGLETDFAGYLVCIYVFEVPQHPRAWSKWRLGPFRIEDDGKLRLADWSEGWGGGPPGHAVRNFDYHRKTYGLRKRRGYVTQAEVRAPALQVKLVKLRCSQYADGSGAGSMGLMSGHACLSVSEAGRTTRNWQAVSVDVTDRSGRPQITTFRPARCSARGAAACVAFEFIDELSTLITRFPLSPPWNVGVGLARTRAFPPEMLVRLPPMEVPTSAVSANTAVGVALHAALRPATSNETAMSGEALIMELTFSHSATKMNVSVLRIADQGSRQASFSAPRLAGLIAWEVGIRPHAKSRRLAVTAFVQKPHYFEFQISQPSKPSRRRGAMTQKQAGQDRGRPAVRLR